jgi:hypothetical protein
MSNIDTTRAKLDFAYQADSKIYIHFPERTFDEYRHWYVTSPQKIGNHKAYRLENRLNAKQKGLIIYWSFDNGTGRRIELFLFDSDGMTINKCIPLDCSMVNWTL